MPSHPPQGRRRSPACCGCCLFSAPVGRVVVDRSGCWASGLEEETRGAFSLANDSKWSPPRHPRPVAARRGSGTRPGLNCACPYDGSVTTVARFNPGNPYPISPSDQMFRQPNRERSPAIGRFGWVSTAPAERQILGILVTTCRATNRAGRALCSLGQRQGSRTTFFFLFFFRESDYANLTAQTVVIHDGRC